jgi:hypothetical protein
MEKDDIIEKGGLLIRVIIEIAGAPKEHIEKTINMMVDMLKKKHKVLKNEIAPVEKHEQYFSAFTESEILISKVDDLTEFVYEFMPSSIEIIEPESKTLTNNDISNLYNDLIGRLHKTDMTLKNSNGEKQLLLKANAGMLRSLFNLALKDGEKTQNEIAEIISIEPEHITKALQYYVEQKVLVEKKGKYNLKNA